MKMRLLILISIFIIIILVPGMIIAQSTKRCEAEFDFTRVGVNPKPGHTIEFGTVNSGDNLNSAPIFPLDVELITVDKQAYSINESFIYVVKLINNSNESVCVPISGKPIYRSGTEYPRGYRHVFIEFQIHDTDDAVVDTYVLYGSTSVHMSLYQLGPGHCMKIRVPGYMQIYSNTQRLKMLGKSAVDVTATVNVYLYDPWDPIFSRFSQPRRSNKLDFKIRGQEVPIVERKARWAKARLTRHCSRARCPWPHRS